MTEFSFNSLLAPERIANALDALPGHGWELCPKCSNMDGGCPFCGHGHIRTVEAEAILAAARERDRLADALRELSECVMHGWTEPAFARGQLHNRAVDIARAALGES